MVLTFVLFLFGLLKAQLPSVSIHYSFLFCVLLMSKGFIGSPIGLTLTPQALSSVMQPPTGGYSLSNPYTNVPPIYKPGTDSNVPTNLNPNLYSGGFPGRSSGFSMQGERYVLKNHEF